MSDNLMSALIGALVGGGFAVLGGVIAGLFALRVQAMQSAAEERRRLAEERKWYAEFFLTRKIDALTTFYTGLVELFNSLFLLEPLRMQQTINEIALQNVDVALRIYLRARLLADIYVDRRAVLV